MIIRHKVMKKIFKIIFFGSLPFSGLIASDRSIEVLYGSDCDWTLKEIEPVSQEIEDLSSPENFLSEKIAEFKKVNEQIDEKFEQPLFSKSKSSRPRPHSIKTDSLIIGRPLSKAESSTDPEEYLEAKAEFAKYLSIEKRFKKLREDIEKIWR